MTTSGRPSRRADGDVASALRCTLIANAFLMDENKRLRVQVSRGFQQRNETRLFSPPAHQCDAPRDCHQRRMTKEIEDDT